MTYTYRLDETVLLAQKWHPGDKLPVKWVAAETFGDYIGPAVPMTLTVTLAGPFNSKEKATASMNNGATPIMKDQIVTDNQVGKLDPNVMKLPANLSLGMYAVAQQVEMGEYKVRFPIMIEVTK